MQSSLLLLALGAYVLYSFCMRMVQWRRNIAAAKASGLPYIVIPVWHLNLWWRFVSPFLTPQLRKLPASWTEPWLAPITGMYSWHKRMSRFEGMDCAALMLVSPKYIYLHVAEAELIADIVSRRNDFPKPTHFYRMLDVFGKNVVSTEGNTWRQHRRIVAPAFSEQNNHLVWNESRYLAELMVQDWVRDGNNTSIRTVAQDANLLTLYVISKAGFGRKMAWPGSEGDSNGALDPREVEDERKQGLSYSSAIKSLIRSLPLVLALPEVVLQYAPFERVRLASKSYHAWRGYMSDMYDEKQDDLDSGATSEGMDLMAALIRGVGGINKQPAPTLSRSEIMGNAFTLIIAGHETTANSIHFSLIYLAMNVPAQRKVQAELDEIFGNRPVSEWSYEDDLPQLFGGMLGACMAEQLRLIPSIQEIPKWTDAPQTLSIGGKQYLIPKHTYVGLSATAVHRNPRWWPHGPPTDPEDPEHPLSNLDNDLEEFKPERWLPDGYRGASMVAEKKGTSGAEQGTTTAEMQELGINAAADTAASLYKPVRGSYIPFSESYRACLGRRFAQVEFFAVLSVILKTWSVELAVDGLATDEDVADMDVQQRRELWSKARRRTRDTLNTRMTSRISLQLRPGVSIPLRFVKRGEERFDGVRV